MKSLESQGLMSAGGSIVEGIRKEVLHMKNVGKISSNFW